MKKKFIQRMKVHLIRLLEESNGLSRDQGKTAASSLNSLPAKCWTWTSLTLDEADYWLAADQTYTTKPGNFWVQ